MKLLAEPNELLHFNRFAHLFRELQVVVQIVNRVQHRTEDFAGFVEVMQVRAAEISAGVATA